MSKEKKTNLVTPPVRCSFVNLAEPRSMEEGGKEFYSMFIPIPKDHDFIKKLKKVVDDLAESEFGNKEWKSPFRDGDQKAETIENAAGCWCITPKTSYKPSVIDSKGRSITDPDELYSGAYYSVCITPYAWTHKTGGRGVGFNIKGVLKVKDGDRFGGSPADMFGDLIESADDTASDDDISDIL